MTNTSTQALRPYLAYGLKMQVRPHRSVRLYRPGLPSVVYDCGSYVKAWQAEGGIALQFESCLLKLIGMRLAALHTLLNHFSLSFAECFDPHYHLTSVNREPIIYQIILAPLATASGITNVQSDELLSDLHTVIFDW
jgi:hypothetical protein